MAAGDLYTPLARAPRWHVIALEATAAGKIGHGMTVLEQYEAVIRWPYRLANLAAGLRDAGIAAAGAAMGATR